MSGSGRPAAGRAPGLRGRLRRLRPRTRPRYKGPSFNRLVPNILTMLGLCAGLSAIRVALDAQWEKAAALIVVAGAIDGLDGRLARMLKGTSRFGAEFDSLSDFLCFGVAPALVLYMWTLHEARGIGFAPCLLFAVCSALRLARFNAALVDPPATPLAEPAPKPTYAQNFFTGVPAPAGAGLALFPLFATLTFSGWDLPGLAAVTRHPLLSGVLLVVVGGLMVSTLPAWSFKNFKIRADYVLPLLLGVGAYVAVLLTEPWAALTAAGLLYVAMLFFSARSYRRLKREAEAMLEPVVVSSQEEQAGG
ncbi:phosphatidylcholine/phosphatidylserine synthase [Roseicella sp. DB1501]|uniref:CDP-alcohol phosphatidyltransferase family protein n=1 Tax=Roseicella sp. DB1501 TaxID=2730925 RepID=UPI0014919D27|nr:phosphatidylcholine/phosphatidylserine synthase [Roseicella sp. DB1501]NOG70704.1 phosphatidylcholine/phosphatidylserine synthase [Roseicella sp. DB1501]